MIKTTRYAVILFIVIAFGTQQAAGQYFENATADQVNQAIELTETTLSECYDAQMQARVDLDAILNTAPVDAPAALKVMNNIAANENCIALLEKSLGMLLILRDVLDDNGTGNFDAIVNNTPGAPPAGGGRKNPRIGKDRTSNPDVDKVLSDYWDAFDDIFGR